MFAINQKCSKRKLQEADEEHIETKIKYNVTLI
jgi:hypothetical protein